jgi:dihydroxyacetone kinase
MSSLDAAGLSISVMKVNEERLDLLDAPTSAPAWPNVSTDSRRPVAERTIRIPAHIAPDIIEHTAGRTRLHRAIEAACEAIITAKDTLTEMDRVVGDGDLGINLARGAEAVRKVIRTTVPGDAEGVLRAIAETLQRIVGGSSGPLYGVLLLRAANTLHGGNPNDPALWAFACREGCHAVSEIGGAVAGERTMLDALIPFATALTHSLETDLPLSEALAHAAGAAEHGAKKTAEMLPRRGRSCYLGERCLGHPDPGAMAAAIWLRAVTGNIGE